MNKRIQNIKMTSPTKLTLRFNYDQFLANLFHVQLPSLARLFWIRSKGCIFIVLSFEQLRMQKTNERPSSQRGSWWDYHSPRPLTKGECQWGAQRTVGSPDALCLFPAPVEPNMLQEKTTPAQFLVFPGLLLSLCSSQLYVILIWIKQR